MRSLSKQYRILCFSRWENVTTARTQYITALQDHHTDFQVQTTGLIINTSLPWIARWNYYLCLPR